MTCARRDDAVSVPDAPAQRASAAPRSSAMPPLAWDESDPLPWRLEITATPEPLLLARLLQKLAVPEIRLTAVRYEAAPAANDARVSLRLEATTGRARLVAARCEKLFAVRSVRLVADSGPAMPGADERGGD